MPAGLFCLQLVQGMYSRRKGGKKGEAEEATEEGTGTPEENSEEMCDGCKSDE